MGPLDRAGLASALRGAVDRPWIEAAWVGGSEAFGRHDAWSDLDLQLVCAPERAEEAFAVVEAALAGLGGTSAVWQPALPADGPYRQRFYQLRALPEWVMLDCCVVRPDRLGPLLDPARHGRPVVWFDRAGRLAPVDDPTLEEAFATRRDQLRGRVALLGHLPEKALARGQVVEAVDLYWRVLLGPLVELLRARHDPRRQDYGFRYLAEDLPPDVVERLGRLAFAGDPGALRDRLREARAWLADLLRAQ